MQIKEIKIAIGNDLAGYELKEHIVETLRGEGFAIQDVGCGPEGGDYPDAAWAVAQKIRAGHADRGVLICGTGNGIAMAANKIPGIRCALCCERLHTLLAREHNDCNVLAMGAWVVDPSQAVGLIKVFLLGRYAGDPKHQARIDRMMAFHMMAFQGEDRQ